MLLDVAQERRQVVAIIDHRDYGFVVGLLEPIHILLLVNPLQLSVLGVVNYKHHHLGLIYQNLQSLQTKLIGVVINIEHILLVNRLFLSTKFLTSLLIKTLDHILRVNKRAEVKRCCVDIYLQRI
jgi:hypothetical protein